MPTFTIVDYLALYDAVESEAAGRDVPDEHEAYEFSTKTFYEDDTGGVYKPDE